MTRDGTPGPELGQDIAAFGEKYQIVGHFCPPSEVIRPYGRLLCSSCNGEHAIEIVKERAPAAALASMHPDTEHLAVLNAKLSQRTIQLAECREKLARPALTVEPDLRAELWPYLMHKAHCQLNPCDCGLKELLPRLAGPAQEGPQ